jgi:hypothetical protein
VAVAVRTVLRLVEIAAAQAAAVWAALLLAQAAQQHQGKATLAAQAEITPPLAVQVVAAVQAR